MRERTDKLVRELVLDDPAPFVPLALTKRGKEIDFEAKTVTVHHPSPIRPRFFACASWVYAAIGRAALMTANWARRLANPCALISAFFGMPSRSRMTTA